MDNVMVRANNELACRYRRHDSYGVPPTSRDGGIYAPPLLERVDFSLQRRDALNECVQLIRHLWQRTRERHGPRGGIDHWRTKNDLIRRNETDRFCAKRGTGITMIWGV